MNTVLPFFKRKNCLTHRGAISTLEFAIAESIKSNSRLTVTVKELSGNLDKVRGLLDGLADGDERTRLRSIARTVGEQLAMASDQLAQQRNQLRVMQDMLRDGNGWRAKAE